jgi:hypothetical protein
MNTKWFQASRTFGHHEEKRVRGEVVVYRALARCYSYAYIRSLLPTGTKVAIFVFFEFTIVLEYGIYYLISRLANTHNTDLRKLRASISMV